MVVVHCPACHVRISMSPSTAAAGPACPRCGAALPAHPLPPEPDPIRSEWPRAQPPTPVTSPAEPHFGALYLAVAAIAVSLGCTFGAVHFWREAWSLGQDNYDADRIGKAEKAKSVAVVCMGSGVLIWLGGGLLLQCDTAWGGKAARAAALGMTAGGFLAVPVSQYSPIFGGWLASLAAPWSVLRLETVGAHLIGLSFAGALAAAGIHAVASRRQEC